MENLPIRRCSALQLSHELAQAIVMRTQPTLGLNVNIMDERGVIIGSGNPDRLFSFHAGARQVLATGEPLTLTPEDAARFPGSQAGVNLPVRLQGKVVGVVGITGLPEQVAGYGRLLQTSTPSSHMGSTRAGRRQRCTCIAIR